MISRTERRSARRIPVRFEAYILTGYKNYTGHIENISGSGMEFSLDYSIDSTDDMRCGKLIALCFQAPSGQVVNLFCKIKRLYENSNNDTVTLGLNISETSTEFADLVNTLDIVTVN